MEPDESDVAATTISLYPDEVDNVEALNALLAATTARRVAEYLAAES